MDKLESSEKPGYTSGSVPEYDKIDLTIKENKENSDCMKSEVCIKNQILIFNKTKSESEMNQTPKAFSSNSLSKQSSF